MINFFTQPFPPELKDYYDSLLANRVQFVDVTNTATADSGEYSATLQGNSGEVEFNSISIPVGVATLFTITNAYAVSGKRAYAYIVAGNNGFPEVINSTCSAGVISIYVNSIQDAEDAVTIGFLFLN
jgi:hypothetical protein